MPRHTTARMTRCAAACLSRRGACLVGWGSATVFGLKERGKMGGIEEKNGRLGNGGVLKFLKSSAVDGGFGG